MKMNNKKKCLYHMRVFFMMFLFTICLTMNVFFCGNYNLYELLDKATVIETGTISESIAANEDDNDTTYFKSSFVNKNTSYNETVTKKICPIPMIAAILREVILHLFCIIVYLFFFLTLFTLLSDKQTLVNQKIRLDI